MLFVFCKRGRRDLNPGRQLRSANKVEIPLGEQENKENENKAL
jgi:hypothetical protein